MLTEKQLLAGIEKLEKFYEHTKIIERNAHNTFLIAKKEINL
jgi:hypothetical protein